MKTGLESLDTGASDITYSGNEGPKSPQQIAEFELMEYMEEFERVFPEMGPLRGTDEYMNNLNDYFRGLASKQNEGIGNLAMADPMLEKEAMSGMAMGGRAGYKEGKMVTVPKHWQSAPDHPKTELAYITKAEKDLLVKKDLHNSLEDGPNVGPGGVMSLNGDYSDMQDGITGADISAAERGEGARGAMSPNRARELRAGAIAGGATPTKKEKKDKQLQKEIKTIKKDVGGGKTLKKNIVTPTQKILYGLVPNDPRNELNFLRSLTAAQRKNLSPALQAKLNQLEQYEEDYTMDDPFDQKFTFEEFQDIATTPGFADYAAKYGSPALKYAGNVGGLEKYVTGKDEFGRTTYDYRQKGDPGYVGVGDNNNRQQATGIQSVAPVTTAAVAPATPVTTPAATSAFAQGTLPFANYYVGEDSPTAAQIAYGKAMGVDPRMYGLTAYAADGGRIGYAGGGITDLRQGYFLGKLVKKVTRGIKKVAKSPLGKAALAYGLYQFGPQLLAKEGFGFKGGFKDLISKGIFKEGSNISPFRAITALSSLPLLMGQEEEEEGSMDGYRGEGMNIPGILDDVFSGKPLDPRDYRFMSRGSYDNGGIAGVRQAALKALPEYKTFNEDDEEEKFSLGGSAGLPPITQETQGMYSQSFSDDETPMPTQSDQMPMMNPMMARQNPMMSMQPRMMAQEGGLMDMGGMEKDYRNEGGFVPIGGQERADDVPARLSKNEFVFTADAVRNAGGGDIDKGAEIMENMMENLEAGGEVSEESQGLDGARAMFATQKRLGEVL